MLTGFVSPAPTSKFQYQNREGCLQRALQFTLAPCQGLVFGVRDREASSVVGPCVKSLSGKKLCQVRSSDLCSDKEAEAGESQGFGDAG